MWRRTWLTAACTSWAAAASAGPLDWFNGVSLGRQVSVPALSYVGRAPRAEAPLTLWYFWATWCEPCRHTVPLLNEQLRRYPAMEIVAVTDEDEATVRDFTAKVPMEMPIGLDRQRVMFEALRIRAMPYAFVLNREQVVVWRGQPKELDAAQRDALLAGRAL